MSSTEEGACYRVWGLHVMMFGLLVHHTRIQPQQHWLLQSGKMKEQKSQDIMSPEACMQLTAARVLHQQGFCRAFCSLLDVC